MIAERPEELQTAHDELVAAAREAGVSPAENRLIDAMLALLAYVERLPPPPPPSAADTSEPPTDARAYVS
jgi:hypothetical protein